MLDTRAQGNVSGLRALKSFVAMLRWAVLLLICVAAVAEARVLLERGTSLRVPHGFTNLGRADAKAEMEIMVFLKQQNMDKLTRELDETSNPKSARYGQHWTIEQVNALTKPSDSTYGEVIQWLKSSGVQRIELGANPEILKVRANVQVIEQLLAITVSSFRHTSGHQYMRSLEHYSVPAHIAAHVSMIGGVNRLPTATAPVPPRPVGSSPTEVTPQTIRKLYNIPAPTTPASGVVQAVVSFLGQYWAPSDLASFQRWAKLMVNPIARLVGFNDPAPSASGVEASLDVDYLVGIPEYVPTWVWSTNGTIAFGNEPWMVFLDDVVSELKKNPGKNFPSVFSMSYQDLEFTVSEAYAKSVCSLFQKITMTGITFVTGSGDWGVGCNPEQGASCNTFTADFPSSCPYVTSLGGTYVNSQGQEVSVDFSSGGFSNYFARPAFQDATIKKYLEVPSVRAISHLFNTSGRAFPDLSTVSTNFQVFANGQRIPVAGTSAATPTFAAMVTMLNDYRVKASMSNMGWINPFLYQAKAASPRSFTDIVAGDTQMRGCCGRSFAAIPGYDAVTGLGSPMFDLLKNLALQPHLLLTEN